MMWTRQHQDYRLGARGGLTTGHAPALFLYFFRTCVQHTAVSPGVTLADELARCLVK